MSLASTLLRSKEFHKRRKQHQYCLDKSVALAKRRGGGMSSLLHYQKIQTPSHLSEQPIKKKIAMVKVVEGSLQPCSVARTVVKPWVFGCFC